MAQALVARGAQVVQNFELSNLSQIFSCAPLPAGASKICTSHIREPLRFPVQGLGFRVDGLLFRDCAITSRSRTSR